MATQVKSIVIALQDWGPNKGAHMGKIVFLDERSNEFSLAITPDKAGMFIALLSDVITESAQNLATALIEATIVNNSNLIEHNVNV